MACGLPMQTFDFNTKCRSKSVFNQDAVMLTLIRARMQIHVMSYADVPSQYTCDNNFRQADLARQKC